MNNLRRELAPISDAAWEAIDAEATRVLKLKLAARKLVDFDGPKGPEFSAIHLGRFENLKQTPVAGVDAAKRRVQQLTELRTSFELARTELDSIERGCPDPDLDPLVEAATRIAAAEDGAVFHGFPAGDIEGISPASPHPQQTISPDYTAYPRCVSEALRLLRNAGVDGPYAIALGPRCYAGLTQATEGGYPTMEVIKKMIDGPIVWAPAVNGAVVLSARGGDFQLTVGRDLSIGYVSHTESVVRLYFTESFTFRVLTAEAAVALVYKDKKK